ncbi:MAG: SAM-dependent methyltransferase, partial [Bacteroidales bacterium]|nr:SAM-dependent methyltransferase [Bacteroidales bacterium]
MIEYLLKNELIPDVFIRLAIRKMLRNRLHIEKCESGESQQEKMNLLIEELKQSPIAIGTQEANEQHYEVPAEFFRLVLGPWMKY